MDKLDYAKFLNLRGLIYFENGYNSKALNSYNLAGVNFKEISEDPFDPFTINNKYDEILGMCYFSDNFEILKNDILDLIAMSLLLGNDYLIIKGFYSLASLHNLAGNFRHAFIFAKHTLELAKKKNFHSDFLVNRLIYIYLLNNEKNMKSLKKDLIIKKIDSENDNIITKKLHQMEQSLDFKNQDQSINQTTEEININNLSKEKEVVENINIFRNPLHTSMIFYLFSDLSFSERNLQKGLYFIERSIENMEKNELNELHLILFYIKKWIILSNMGREANSEYLIEFSQKLINLLYHTDSLKNLEYLRYIQTNSSALDPPRQDLVNEIIKKTRKVNDVNNINSLLQKYYNLISLINSKGGVPEIIEIYREFDVLEKQIFENKESELRRDLKDNLIFSNLKSVLKSNKTIN